jgi:hypothetical protein
MTAKIEYLDENNNILFKENILLCNFIIKRKDVIIWHKKRLVVTLIEHNYDENKITILVKQQ